jgi:hypothetical protein
VFDIDTCRLLKMEAFDRAPLVTSKQMAVIRCFLKATRCFFVAQIMYTSVIFTKTVYKLGANKKEECYINATAAI